jgi:hypothetical protein
MNSPAAEDLLRIWEEGHAAHPVRRALALLDAAATPDGASWAEAPIGLRDGRLIELHERLFGSLLQTVTRCPRCDEVLESSFATGDIVARGRPPTPGVLRWQLGEAEVGYRLPNSRDLLEIAQATADAAEAERLLLRRCVSEALQAGREVAVESLPGQLVEALADEMARLDPDADIHIRLDCPACGHGWSVGFDIVSYLWGALDDWAQRTLADVHLLAGAYGWSEREVLGLSATRRRHYVEMVLA